MARKGITRNRSAAPATAALAVARNWEEPSSTWGLILLTPEADRPLSSTAPSPAIPPRVVTLPPSGAQREVQLSSAATIDWGDITTSAGTLTLQSDDGCFRVRGESRNLRREASAGLRLHDHHADRRGVQRDRRRRRGEQRWPVRRTARLDAASAVAAEAAISGGLRYHRHWLQSSSRWHPCPLSENRRRHQPDL